MLVTERPGNLRLVSADGKLSGPLNGVPQVWAKGQGGLLDVALSPDFKQDRMVYLSYAEGGGEGGKAGTAVGRGRLSEDLTAIKDFNVIFRQEPKLSVGNHFGSRLVFDRDGYLFITLGENNDRPTAQDLDKLQGKIVRLYPDGKVPKDNPFVGQKKAFARKSGPTANATRKARHSIPGVARSGKTSTAPRGGDEINIIERGKKITAGRWQPTASTIPACRSRKPRAKPPKAPWARTMSGKIPPA